MLKLSVKAWCLCLCFIEVIWLLAAQAIGSLVLLIPCLVCFVGIVVWAALRDLAVPMILFFLPFAPLLKMKPGTISFFTISLLIVYMVYVVKGSRNVRITHFVPALALMILTATVKVIKGYDFSNVYILFVISLLLIPFCVIEMGERDDFYYATVFFVLGIVTAALTSQMLSDSSTIARYINVIDEMGIQRRTGYYSDPNFYSAHITATLGGILVLLLNKIERIQRFVLVGMVVVLLYCGLLSISKSFLLVSVCLFICWFLAFLFQQGRISAKIVMIFTVLVIVAFILSSSVFTNLLDLMIFRLSKSTNLSDLTTHRVELWASYMRTLGEDPWMLWFGNGYSSVMVDGRAAHNTLIQSVYQFGLIGCGILAAWFVCFIRTMLNDSRSYRLGWAQSGILLIGSFGPWMALDYLFLDELFLIPLYVCIAIRFCSRVSHVVHGDE